MSTCDVTSIDYNVDINVVNVILNNKDNDNSKASQLKAAETDK